MENKITPTPESASLTDFKGMQETTDFVKACYVDNPLVRLIVKLIPYAGSPIDGLIVGVVENMLKERLKIVLDRLESNEITLDEQTAQSHEIIHCIMVTLRAASRAHQKERIERFIDLLSSFLNREEGLDLNTFEDYLKILESLSEREMVILLCIDHYESKFGLSSSPSIGTLVNSYWDQCMTDIRNRLNIEEDEANALISRLIASGCFDSFVGTYDMMPPKGRLSPVFYKMKKYAIDRWEKSSKPK